MSRYFDALGLGIVVLAWIVPEILGRRAVRTFRDLSIFVAYIILLILASALWFIQHTWEEQQVILWIFGPVLIILLPMIYLKSAKKHKNSHTG